VKITCVVDDRVLPDWELKAEHGASFLIDSEGGQVLFDTAQSGSVLLHNMESLGIKPEEIDLLVLSHGHNDHTGGLAGLLERVPGIPLYASPDIFRDRFRKTDTGPRKVGPEVDREWLESRVSLHLSAEPAEVLPGVWTTGEITSRPEPEGRSSTHLVRQGAGWAADSYLDDMSLVLETKSGLVLLCGCCHAGLLNTLARVHEIFGREPSAVVGGVHLVHADTPTMDRVIAKLRDYGPPQLWVSHCTGDRSFLRLKAAFGEMVAQCRAGWSVTL
jgi:7,8-dihydropterin-6-yl-methyl-4-(beta-D-ribofuranosyl)aminobenzene 5'-phosphate synthase